MTTTDVTIRCVDCEDEFVFTAGEQAYYAERGLRPPKRCKPCRDYKRQEREQARA